MSCVRGALEDSSSVTVSVAWFGLGPWERVYQQPFDSVLHRGADYVHAESGAPEERRLLRGAEELVCRASFRGLRAVRGGEGVAAVERSVRRVEGLRELFHAHDEVRGEEPRGFARAQAVRRAEDGVPADAGVPRCGCASEETPSGKVAHLEPGGAPPGDPAVPGGAGRVRCPRSPRPALPLSSGRPSLEARIWIVASR